MKFLDTGDIQIDREYSELDDFTIKFVNVLKRHTKYVIVSGYVSILLGRSRSSEDIDILIPEMKKENFYRLFHDLSKNGFECINTTTPENAYKTISEKTAIRYSEQTGPIPNVELKFAKSKIDDIAIQTQIKIILGKSSLQVSNLSLQIAFKEEILKSDKDIEDARHIRNVAKEIVTEDKIYGFKVMIRELYR